MAIRIFGCWSSATTIWFAAAPARSLDHERQLWAEGYRHQPSTAERKLAIAAARSVDAIIAGVDLVYDRGQVDQPWVVEINACPSWRATQAVADQDISRHLLSEIKRPRTRRTSHLAPPNKQIKKSNSFRLIIA